MRGVYEQRLQRQDVGRRVSVRRWVADPGRGRVPSDVVGRLVAWSDDDVLTIQRRDGSEQSVALADVLSSRVVPER